MLRALRAFHWAAERAAGSAAPIGAARQRVREAATKGRIIQVLLQGPAPGRPGIVT
jgi:hypothetical protein